MKVSELIEYLKTIPPELPVIHNHAIGSCLATLEEGSSTFYLGYYQPKSPFSNAVDERWWIDEEEQANYVFGLVIG
jgi:hypothetical protein